MSPQMSEPKVVIVVDSECVAASCRNPVDVPRMSQIVFAQGGSDSPRASQPTEAVMMGATGRALHGSAPELSRIISRG